MEKLGYILLVDDSDNDVELTRRTLQHHNLVNEVVDVRDGVEALDFLHRRGKHKKRPPADPIVMLLDIKMPKVDGIEVLREIRNAPHLSHIPVVMLTSSREGPDVDECYRLRANAYVVKPVDFEQFADAIKTIGRFWAVLNELPQGMSQAAAGGK
jgi:CheY-like chemotaxis protein